MDDAPDIEEEILLESDSDIGEEIHPLGEELNVLDGVTYKLITGEALNTSLKDSNASDIVNKNISNPKELLNILNNAVKEKFPILIVAEGIKQDALALIIKNKLRSMFKVAAIKAPAFGERKNHYLEDISILTVGPVIREDMGFTVEKSSTYVLGSAAKVVITKDSTVVVTNGSTREAIEKRVNQIKSLIDDTVNQ